MGIISLNNKILSLNNKALYFNPPTKCISFCSISNTGCGGTSTCACLCVCSAPAMSGADSYTLCLCGSISTINQGASSCGCVQIKCNGTQVYCCCVGANCCMSNANYSLTVNATDYVHMVIYAQTTDIACSGNANATGNIVSVSSISGCFAVGSPSACNMYTG